MSTAISTLASLLPVADAITGKPVKASRLKDVRTAYSIYQQLRRGDQESALNRARQQLVYDGWPPFDPDRLRDSGQAGIANINVGLMKSYVDDATRPMLDQLNSLDRYLNVRIKPKANDSYSSEQLAEWENIISEQHYLLITSDPGWSYIKQELVRQREFWGVCVPYYMDAYDWKWETQPLGEFLIPYFTKVGEKYVEIACMVRSRQPHEIAKYLEKDSAGWNSKAIRAALANAKPRTIKQWEYERMEMMWKNNNLWISSQCDEITTVDMWVTEVQGGAVSHFVFCEDGQGTDFLFKAVNRFASQEQAYIFFNRDVGTNGFYHSIRGIGYAALDLVQELNRTFSAFMDALRLQGKLLLTPKDDNALQNLLFIEHSAYLLTPTGVEINQRQNPNFADAMLPGLEYLKGLLGGKMSNFSPDASLPDFNRANKQAVNAKVSQIAKMGSGNSELFFASWERLLCEQMRRIIRPNYLEEEPGGKEVALFKKDCKDLGVPDDIWDRINLRACRAERAIGAGSAAEQIQQYSGLMELYDKGFFDDEGSQSFRLDATRAMSNNDKALRYVGKGVGARPGQDQRNAVDENDFMAQGTFKKVWPNDDHFVHAVVHIGGDSEEPTNSLFDDAKTLSDALQQQDDETVLKIVPAMTMKHAHAEQHVERLRNAKVAGPLRQKLEQIGGTIYNAQKKVIAIQEKQAREQSQQQMGQNGNGNGAAPGQAAETDFNLQRQLIETQMKLKGREEEHQQALAHRDEVHQQKMQEADQSAAQKLALQHALTVASATTPGK